MPQKNIRNSKTFRRALALASEGQIARALDLVGRRFHGKRRMEARYQLLSAMGRMVQSNTQGGDAMTDTPVRMFVYARADGVDIVAERPKGVVWLGGASFEDKKAVAFAAQSLSFGVKINAEDDHNFVVTFVDDETRRTLEKKRVLRHERHDGGKIVVISGDKHGTDVEVCAVESERGRAIMRKVKWMARLAAGKEYTFPVIIGSPLYKAVLPATNKDPQQAAQNYVAAVAGKRAYRAVVTAAMKAGHNRAKARELARAAMRRYHVVFTTGIERVVSLTPEEAERWAHWRSVKTIELVEEAARA